MSTDQEIRVTEEHIKQLQSVELLQGSKEAAELKGEILQNALVKVRQDYDDGWLYASNKKGDPFLSMLICTYIFSAHALTNGSIFFLPLISVAASCFGFLVFMFIFQRRRARKLIDKIEKENYPNSILHNKSLPQTLIRLLTRAPEYDKVNLEEGLSIQTITFLRKTIRKDLIIQAMNPALAIGVTILVKIRSDLSLTHWIVLSLSTIWMSYLLTVYLYRLRLLLTAFPNPRDSLKEGQPAS